MPFIEGPDGNKYHEDCFVCSDCRKPVMAYCERDCKILCVDCLNKPRSSGRPQTPSSQVSQVEVPAVTKVRLVAADLYRQIVQRLRPGAAALGPAERLFKERYGSWTTLEAGVAQLAAELSAPDIVPVTQFIRKLYIETK